MCDAILQVTWLWCNSGNFRCDDVMSQNVLNRLTATTCHVWVSLTSQIRSAFLRRGERKLMKNSGARTGTRMEFLVPVLAPAHIRFGVKLYLFIFIFIIKRSYFHPARHGVIWQTTPDTIRRGTSTYRYSYSTWFNCLLPDRLSPIYTCTIPAYFPRSPPLLFLFHCLKISRR